MNYYEVCLLGKRAPLFTYSFHEKVQPHTLVVVEVRGKTHRAAIVTEVEKPDFKTHAIVETLPYRFDAYQIETARFVKEYYACTFGEALALFEPFEMGRSLPQHSEFETDIVLSDTQERAFEALQKHGSALLFAPTGSGKTEIYMKLFAKALQEGKSSVFLMPEISLTPQMEKRLKVHFGDRVAIWHSKLTKKRKTETLEKIRSGEVRIVAGPRSALFLPLHDIGVIVVDEEHDDSYKAHNRPRYHARDLALFMGKKLGARVVLGSATPSAATYARQPVVRIRDPYVKTKKRYIFERGGCALTPTMIEALEAHHKAGGQALVFLPTRANFKYLYCDNCGYTVECPYCSVGMSLHRNRRLVRCHYCGYAEKIPESCPKCGSIVRADRIGTAEVVEQLGERFPEIKIQQFDKDTITTANKLQKALDRFSNKETDVLVGTQMLAKGHDYADITLAIVLGLDYILALPDYRARERAQSLFVQIAGRAGRAREATVIVQTNQPEFFSEYIGDYEKFLKEELQFREGLYPPTMHLCRLLFASKDEKKGLAEVERVRVLIERFDKVEIVGSGKAPIEKIAGKFRFNILLRSPNRSDLLRVVKAVDDGSFEVDMDPVDFA
ncbi:primosomal protein N' [Hydrogenimonas cancrithermarum]|uniref:Replication restart protein PriA n=1 Tax=Hydrogenimonas cancrithermarum TaxID=2993563 RepID=A0ABM8FK38_9BACT|nr:primosomal protein N' [Hydrogenimonas cancrithermarum]BDY12668.1 primosomal protein N' [Hydrogenimonas cancrithermarum]